MNSSWTKTDENTGVLRVTVSGDDWKQAQKKVFNKAKANLQIKGFRKGQVPENVARKRIKESEILSMAIEDFLQPALLEGIAENSLELAATPTLNISSLTPEEAVLEFTCTLYPEVTLGDYKNIEVKKEPVVVSEEEVNAEVSKIQDRFADWVLRDEDEPAEAGDQVTIDFIGEKDGIPFEGGSGTEYPLVLGSGTFIPGFEEQLIGIKPEEERDIHVTFPQDYPSEELAGAEVVFKVKAHDIKYKELPEVNDELIARLKRDGIETVEKYKEEALNRLTEEKEKSADQAYTNQIIDQVVNQAQVNIPAVMIDDEVDHNFKQLANRLQQSGFTLEQYMQAAGTDEAAIKETMRPEAEARVKASLVLEAIADAEAIEVSDEELDNEYKLLSDMYQMPEEQIRKILSPDSIRYDLRQNKALNFLKEQAKSE